MVHHIILINKIRMLIYIYKRTQILKRKFKQHQQQPPQQQMIISEIKLGNKIGFSIKHTSSKSSPHNINIFFLMVLEYFF